MRNDWKETGIEWLPKIPKKWTLSRVKDTTYLKARIGWQNLRSDEFEDATNWYCVTGQDFDCGAINWANCYCVSEERYEQDKFIQLKNDDLLLTKDGTIGKTALIRNLPKKATLNSGVFVIRPVFKMYSNRFMFWILNSNVFTYFIEYYKTGSTVPHLYQNIFERFTFPLPPLSTQHAIANYLDKKLAVIDRQISLLEKKRDRYTALRKSLINQVVRRGLNPDVELKNSGIEWLGEIPKHWKVKRVKDVAIVQTGNTPSKEIDLYYDIEGFPWVKPDELFDLKETNTTKEKLSILGKSVSRIANKGDILICCIGSIGKMGIAGVDMSYNQQINSLSFIQQIDKKFSIYLMFSTKDEHNRLADGNVVPIINSTKQRNIKIPIPPLSEQRAIADYLDKQSDKIDRIISNINAQLVKLAQLKKSLINECVMGERVV